MRRAEWSVLVRVVFFTATGILITSQTAWAQSSDTITISRFVLAYIGGLMLNLTPCVYPLVPVTISFFAGQSHHSLRYTTLLASCYVLGLAITYSILGLVASVTGGFFGAVLQWPIVVIIIAMMMVALGLSMCGLFEIKVPSTLSNRFGSGRTGVAGAFIMGMSVGIIAAPCIGPFVAGMLLYVSQLGNPAIGFWLFFVLALGLGTPYLFLAIFASRINRFPKSGGWLLWVKQFLGCVLFGFALYLVFPLLPKVMGRWVILAFLVGCGLYLGWLSKASMRGGWLWVRRVIGSLLIIAAVTLPPGSSVSSPIEWVPYTQSTFAQANGKPILADVSADWCLPCREMEMTTFRDPHVIEHAEDFLMVKVDVTNADDPNALDFIERFNVFGAPTLLVFDEQAVLRPDLSTAGYVSAKELLQIMHALHPDTDTKDPS